MITQSDILKYVKQSLGYPHVLIEFDDRQIMEVIQGDALKMYSNYYPYKSTIMLKPSMIVNPYPSKMIDLSSIEDLIGISEVFHGSQDVLYTQYTDTLYKLHDDLQATVITTINIRQIHKKDMSTLRNQDYNRFKQLCLILVARLLLPIRKYNSQISTPVGEMSTDVETVQTLADSYQDFVDRELDNIGTMVSRMPFKIA